MWSRAAYPEDLSRRDAYDVLLNCLERQIDLEAQRERKWLLGYIEKSLHRADRKVLLVEIVGANQSAYKYVYLILADGWAEVGAKTWKTKNVRKSKLYSAGEMSEISELFAEFDYDSSLPWGPMGQTYNHHPVCFFIALSSNAEVKQYAVYDATFAAPPASPPIAIAARVFRFLDKVELDLSD